MRGKEEDCLALFDSFRNGKKVKHSIMDDLTDFYHNHRAIVYTYFLKVTGSQDASEELTQETFFQAVTSIHRFKGNSSLKTWLLQIARNIYRNKVRTWVKDRNLFDDEDVSEQGDHSFDPQTVSLQKQTKQDVLNILTKLPEDYRDVLIFKEVHGLSHVEIAEILNKTPQTTKVLLYRAKQKFRDLYKNEVVFYDESM